ncbi:MAG: Peptidoglycan-binding lysin protein [Firmicutes bacterium]|nr:Peptidoglycan-binding lysin protein [Bacillota bacterium]
MLTKQHLTDSLKKIVTCSLLVGSTVILTGGNYPANTEMVHDVYIVKSGDTLQSISDEYMQKNNYGPRNRDEFMYGIIQLNYNDIFKNRDENKVLPNDELRINYWVKTSD